MKTRTITIYSVDELSDQAQQKAHENFLSSEDFYFWGDENEQTLKAFCDIFPVTIKECEYGYRNFINFSLNTGDEYQEKCFYDITGIRLLKYIYNNYGGYLFKPKYLGSIDKHVKHPCFHNKTAKIINKEYSVYYSRIQKENCCVLTGYCIDDDILQPLYDFLKKPDKTSTFEDLMKNCLDSWISACNADYEATQTLEYFIDHAQANDYEFDIDGNRL
jgi:hypothetical protein